MRLAALAISVSLAWVATAQAATLEPVGSFAKPIFITSDPADPNRVFIVEREGRVVQVQGGAVSGLADLTSLVSCCTGERGLLSIAPAPDFGDSGRFYAAYAGKAVAGGVEGDIHVDAFQPDGSGLGREPIFSIPHSTLANHNGGQIQFGPDGYLYLSVGDGGGSGDPFESGQDLETLLGKLLRIDPRPGQEPAYVIPPGNPFAAGAGLDEIWGYGLRNPWRFSFDRGSGDLIVADVGQGAREEVDFAPSPAAGAVGGAGDNYGWNCREGFMAFPGAPTSCPATGFTDPVFDYPHTDPGGGKAHGCSITGGYVVRDASLGDLYGRYVYADFCQGEIRSLVLPASAGGRASDDRSEGLEVANPTSFGEDSCGRLYVASNSGAVYRLVGAEPASCGSPATAPPGQPDAPPPNETSLGTQGRLPEVRLALRSRRIGSGAKLLLTARVSSCAGREGATVQLRRGGRPLAAKPLDGSCVARFRAAVAHRATFRALLQPGDGSEPLRSRRLVVAPG